MFHASADDIDFYRESFLSHEPDRYALMCAPGSDRKYDDRKGSVTDKQIYLHLAGEITLAVPFAHAGLANDLPLDVDAGGLAAITMSIQSLAARGIWSFGQFCPRPSWIDDAQRGYVYAPFADLVNASRLQILGSDLVAGLDRPHWKIEIRAHGADTRLPFGRHTHTGRFGDLILLGEQVSIDDDPAAALNSLRKALRANPVELLPLPPASPPTAGRGAQTIISGRGITIDRFNQEMEIEQLLASYGARQVAGRRGLYFCPFHDDQHASLQVYIAKRGHKSAQVVCRCLSQYSNCPLAQNGQNDSFNVYCIGESLSTKDALRQLNNRNHRPPKSE
jgi:hypothetical protein